jgi:hypothetical protein
MIVGRLTVVAAVAVTVLAGAEATNALISSNTIDELATHKRDGRLVRAVATTRRAAHVTDTRRWCEPVDLAAVLEER